MNFHTDVSLNQDIKNLTAIFYTTSYSDFIIRDSRDAQLKGPHQLVTYTSSHRQGIVPRRRCGGKPPCILCALAAKHKRHSKSVYVIYIHYIFKHGMYVRG